MRGIEPRLTGLESVVLPLYDTDKRTERDTRALRQTGTPRGNRTPVRWFGISYSTTELH